MARDTARSTAFDMGRPTGKTVGWRPGVSGPRVGLAVGWAALLGVALVLLAGRGNAQGLLTVQQVQDEAAKLDQWRASIDVFAPNSSRQTMSLFTLAGPGGTPLLSALLDQSVSLEASNLTISLQDAGTLRRDPAAPQQRGMVLSRQTAANLALVARSAESWIVVDGNPDGQGYRELVDNSLEGAGARTLSGAALETLATQNAVYGLEDQHLARVFPLTVQARACETRPCADGSAGYATKLFIERDTAPGTYLFSMKAFDVTDGSMRELPGEYLGRFTATVQNGVLQAGSLQVTADTLGRGDVAIVRPAEAGASRVPVARVFSGGPTSASFNWASDVLAGTLLQSTSGACVRDAYAACLLGAADAEGYGSRLHTAVRMWDFSNPSGRGVLYPGRVMSFKGQRAESFKSVFYESFDPGNFEVGIKAVDACIPALGNRMWVFVGWLTNAETELTITDTISGAVKSYYNPKNNVPVSITDTSAFNCN